MYALFVKRKNIEFSTAFRDGGKTIKTLSAKSAGSSSGT